MRIDGVRRFVWTLREIKSLPEFGDGVGWFYGLVHDDGLHFGEVYPGLGYTSGGVACWWSPRQWWWAAKDVTWAKQRWAVAKADGR